MQSTVALFFGSFNPIHNGHLMLARYMLNTLDINEIWFVISPQNPFKSDTSLADVSDRLEMAKLAVDNSTCMKVSDIELHLPKPSYTVNTLRALHERNPETEFSIIMGADNLSGLPNWREAQTIIDNHRIYVYPRRNVSMLHIDNEHITMVTAPQIEVSSTLLRQWIADGRSIENYSPAAVVKYIEKHKLYHPIQKP